MTPSLGQEVPAPVRDIFAAIDGQDLARTSTLLDDSFLLHYNGIPDPIPKAILLDMLRAYYAAFPDMRHDMLEILPSGNSVTVRLTVHATHEGTYEGIPATGRKVAVGAIHILRISSGRIAEWWAAEDDLGLLRQIGAVIGPPADNQPDC
jgi:predicted ester cyclase